VNRLSWGQSTSRHGSAALPGSGWLALLGYMELHEVGNNVPGATFLIDPWSPIHTGSARRESCYHG
jgi:hypothetical protein